VGQSEKKRPLTGTRDCLQEVVNEPNQWPPDLNIDPPMQEVVKKLGKSGENRPDSIRFLAAGWPIAAAELRRSEHGRLRTGGFRRGFETAEPRVRFDADPIHEVAHVRQ
jgi:hypothetical protein